MYEDEEEKAVSPYGDEDWYEERTSWKWMNTVMRVNSLVQKVSHKVGVSSCVKCQELIRIDRGHCLRDDPIHSILPRVSTQWGRAKGQWQRHARPLEAVHHPRSHPRESPVLSHECRLLLTDIEPIRSCSTTRLGFAPPITSSTARSRTIPARLVHRRIDMHAYLVHTSLSSTN